MKKLFTWTVLYAISVHPSSFVLKASEATFDFPKKSLKAPSKKPSLEDLQREVEIISFEHFFLSPDTDSLAVTSQTSETALVIHSNTQETTQEATTSEHVLSAIEQSSPVMNHGLDEFLVATSTPL